MPQSTIAPDTVPTSTMVEATLPADQFALHETLNEVSDAEFRMVRLVAHRTGHLTPFLWASSDDREALFETLREDPSTANVEVLSELDEECLLRMGWRAHVRVIIYIILEESATILGGYGRNDTWRFRILFPEHGSVSDTYDFCEEYGIDLSLERVYELSDSPMRGQLGLTEEQYDAIGRAYEAGYYDVPRKINQEELAERFDVSHQALSERLRRGHEKLIANGMNPVLEERTPS